MPAIQPARLRQQAAALAEHFNDPTAYVRSLHYLMDFYADRARRAGHSTQPGPLITAYNVRPPVLRTLLQELLPFALQDPAAGLALCDALWTEPYLEFRLLAAMLLGHLPLDPPEAITGRLQSWITTNLEFQQVDALLTSGVERLHRENPKALIRLIQTWLESTKSFYQQLGLRALLPLIQNPDFENVPVFFRLIQPLVTSVPTGLRPDILDVLAALAQRSPNETAYFLRQMLTLSDTPGTPWLVRQSLDAFPPDLQKSLRNAARGNVSVI
jgi:hypothetical protein